jgi:hypothetical protein
LLPNTLPRLLHRKRKSGCKTNATIRGSKLCFLGLTYSTHACETSDVFLGIYKRREREAKGQRSNQSYEEKEKKTKLHSSYRKKKALFGAMHEQNNNFGHFFLLKEQRHFPQNMSSHLIFFNFLFEMMLFWV